MTRNAASATRVTAESFMSHLVRVERNDARLLQRTQWRDMHHTAFPASIPCCGQQARALCRKVDSGLPHDGRRRGVRAPRVPPAAIAEWSAPCFSTWRRIIVSDLEDRQCAN